ncbi:MAG TPA: di-heme oxidoredictase family protein [Pirellulales bacterium]|jgi:CxxC motif-containing protein (DUF1111 family)|nr:di-heme oxidoredictase family protein [Pirellulales bacterium]
MAATARALGCALGLSSLLALGLASARAQADAKAAESIQRGRQLFEHVWTSPGNGVVGDGLGPMFNERSCIACHSLGGIGGAGPALHNVELLTVKPPKDPKKLRDALGKLPQLHRAFSSSTSIVLHRFSTDPGYGLFRGRLLGLIPPEDDPNMPVFDFEAAHQPPDDRPIKPIDKEAVTLLLSQRNTTPLFGLGMIDSISQTTIQETIAVQHHEDQNVTGRFVGRFGWRGQVLNLRGFVLGACAVELGLQNKDHLPPISPLSGAAANANDLDAQQCDDLVAFVAALPVPERAKSKTHGEEVDAVRGEHLFEQTGCAVCHRPQLGTVFGIYSDLLVHDMGTSLEDPAPAASAPSTMYYGPPPDLYSPKIVQQRREWKTPPLWGIRDSGPYLHDGRANTIDEAILAHGGEAKRSVAKYVRLTTSQRYRLAYFLKTLAAPDQNLLAGLGRAAKG